MWSRGSVTHGHPVSYNCIAHVAVSGNGVTNDTVSCHHVTHNYRLLTKTEMTKK